VTMQVAIHLNDVEHEAFSRWLASAAVAVDPDDPHLEASEAISAMIRVTMRYTDITGQPAAPRACRSEGPEGATHNPGSGHDRPPLISLSQTPGATRIVGARAKARIPLLPSSRGTWMTTDVIAGLIATITTAADE
jgi:hypothetical protein